MYRAGPRALCEPWRERELRPQALAGGDGICGSAAVESQEFGAASFCAGLPNRIDSHQSHLKGLSVILPKGKVMDEMTSQGPSQPAQGGHTEGCAAIFSCLPYLTVSHHRVATPGRDVVNFESRQRPWDMAIIFRLCENGVA